MEEKFNLEPALLSQVLEILDTVVDSYLNQGLVSAKIVKSLDLKGTSLILGLLYPYPCASLYKDRVMEITKALSVIEIINEVECEVDFAIATQSAIAVEPVANIKQIIAVASGKGGVGKSTTAVNLALALAHEGAKVGILDADIYGPSIPIMLGIPDFRPISFDGKTMTPAQAHGILAQSIGFMLKDDEAAVWRGPMAAGALTQLLNDTNWPELDYLVLDLPPGTGDIQLTLSQSVPITTAVVITTPQDIALADAKKGIQMFQKVNVPIAGLIENMSYYRCPECGHTDHPFGYDGGVELAKRYQVPVLGCLPLLSSIRSDLDQGLPTVIGSPDGEVAKTFFEIARTLTASLVSGQDEIIIEETDE